MTALSANDLELLRIGEKPDKAITYKVIGAVQMITCSLLSEHNYSPPVNCKHVHSTGHALVTL